MANLNEHQIKIWNKMISLIDQYKSDGEKFNAFIRELEGLMDAGEFKDESLIKEWYKFWGPLEIYNADKLFTGEEVKREEVIKDLDAMRLFLTEQLK